VIANCKTGPDRTPTSAGSTARSRTSKRRHRRELPPFNIDSRNNRWGETRQGSLGKLTRFTAISTAGRPNDEALLASRLRRPSRWLPHHEHADDHDGGRNPAEDEPMIPRVLRRPWLSPILVFVAGSGGFGSNVSADRLLRGPQRPAGNRKGRIAGGRAPAGDRGHTRPTLKNANCRRPPPLEQRSSNPANGRRGPDDGRYISTGIQQADGKLATPPLGRANRTSRM